MASNSRKPSTAIDTERNAFIGAYITRTLKKAIRDEAKRENRTLSQQLMRILTERYLTPQERAEL